MTDYEILRAERFGGREHFEVCCCTACSQLIDWDDFSVVTDGLGRAFCDRDCCERYYHNWHLAS